MFHICRTIRRHFSLRQVVHWSAEIQTKQWIRARSLNSYFAFCKVVAKTETKPRTKPGTRTSKRKRDQENRKPTTKYKIFLQERWKRNTILGASHRAKRIATNWKAEVKAIKQLFIKAEYPTKLVNEVIRDFENPKCDETIIPVHWFDERPKVGIRLGPCTVRPIQFFIFLEKWNKQILFNWTVCIHFQLTKKNVKLEMGQWKRIIFLFF